MKGKPIAKLIFIALAWLAFAPVIGLLQVDAICGQLLIGNWGRSRPPWMTLRVVGPRDVPSPSSV